MTVAGFIVNLMIIELVASFAISYHYLFIVACSQPLGRGPVLGLFYCKSTKYIVGILY